MLGFDVFLSHNSTDIPAVRALKQVLTERGLKCWLDDEQLQVPDCPGKVCWHRALRAFLQCGKPC